MRNLLHLVSGRTRDSRRHWAGGILAAAGVCAAAPVSLAKSYTLLDLGSLGKGYSQAYGYSPINASGQVAGISGDLLSTSNHAFRTSPNAPINPATDDLGLVPGAPLSSSYGLTINATGQVAGFTYDFATRATRAFRTTPTGGIGASSDLGLDNSIAFALNAAGTVVGTAGNRAFRGTPDGVIDTSLGSLGGAKTTAYGINDLGQMVGGSDTSTGKFHAYRTAPNGSITDATDLGSFGGSVDSSRAYAINRAGQVVGGSWSPSGEAHAFRTRPNAVIDPLTDDLGSFGPGLSAEATSINSIGQVVGYSNYVIPGTNERTGHGFFADVDGPMVDVNTLLPANSGWELMAAAGINDSGQIAGWGMFNGQQRGYVLTPVPEGGPTDGGTPEPGSLALVAIAGLGLLRRSRRIPRR